MKTSNQILRNQRAAYCPTCERHTEQSRGRTRGERHCWCCGSSFTLKDSRKAQTAEKVSDAVSEAKNGS